MNQHATTTITGEVTDLFSHRFIVKTTGGKILADIGPKGCEQITLACGDIVEMTGTMKPSELKVDTLTRANKTTVIERKRPATDDHDHVAPDIACRTAHNNGLIVVGAPRRKSKHFEVLGRDNSGDYVELHIELDGKLRKSKPGDPAEPKWAISGDARFD